MYRKLADALTETALALWRSILVPLSPTGTARESLVPVRAASKLGHGFGRGTAARFGRP